MTKETLQNLTIKCTCKFEKVQKLCKTNWKVKRKVHRKRNEMKEHFYGEWQMIESKQVTA